MTIADEIIKYIKTKKNPGFLPWQLMGEVPNTTPSEVYFILNSMTFYGDLKQKEGKYYLPEVKS